MGREIYDIINDMAEVLNASQMQKLQEVLVKRLSENTVSDYFTEWTEMNLELILMSENDIAEFKKNVQCAFQKGFEDVFGKCEETILPEKNIDQSLNGKGSVAYKAVLDGETVGGVIVAIDTETQHNHLDLSNFDRKLYWSLS